MRMHLSWTNLMHGVWSGGNQHVHRWEEIMLHLNKLEVISGTVRVQLMDEPDIGPLSVGLIAENKNYLVTLLEATEDDTDVRTFNNLTVTPQMIDVLGDFWDARSITNEFGLVIMMFKEFFETGDVSRQWLN